MNDDDKQRIRDLFLGYEELDGDIRREVDDWLARDASARAQLEKLRELEARAREPIPEIEVDGDGMAALTIEEQASESRSRAALRDRLGLPPVEAHGSSRWSGRGARPWMRRAWIPAAAAAVVLLGLWMRPHGQGLSDLQVLTIEAAAPTRSARESGVLRTGDQFALTFRLGSDADVVIFHLDPAGQLELVLPEPGGGAAPRFGAGPVRIPGTDAAERWQLDGNPGPEDFVVAIRSESGSNVAELESALRAEVLGIESRARILERVQGYLESTMDDVGVIRIHHRR